MNSTSEPEMIGGVPILNRSAIERKEARVKQRQELLTMVPKLSHEETADLLLSWGDKVRDLSAALAAIAKTCDGPAHWIVAENGRQKIRAIAIEGIRRLKLNRTERG